MRLAWYVILACKVNNLIFDTQMMRLGVLQPARITLWASTNCPSSKARVTSVNSLSKLTRWSWQAPAHPLKTSWILRYTWERPPMTGRSTPTLLSIFFEGPTLLSPFLSSRTLLSNKHFFEHFFELITQKSTFLSAHLSTVTFLRTFLRTQKSGFTLLSTFLSGFTHLRAFLSAQKSPQGHSGPLCYWRLNLCLTSGSRPCIKGLLERRVIMALLGGK